jgi:iron complex transport system substrate-binding protein
LSNPVSVTVRRRGWSRRRALLALLVALALAATAAACGGDDDGGGTSGGGSGTEAGGGAEEGAFPVTIEHQRGTTEIAERPERVVTVGFTDQDTVLAFGITPVGVRDWYGDQPHATFPWAQDELGDAEPEIVGDGTAINVEAVAGLRPDLILAIYEEVDEETYATLSQIAPTITQSDEFEQYLQPWQETTRTVGRALGEPERAEELITGVEDAYAAARADHPEFEGTQAAMAQFGDSPGHFYLTHPEDPKASFLIQLGFEIPEEITDVIVDNEGEEVSFENLQLVDQEIVVWLAGFESPDLIAELRDSPLYQQLAVAQEGRDLFLEDAVDALSWGTVLSIPAAIEDVVPQLAEVLAGGSGGAGG